MALKYDKISNFKEAWDYDKLLKYANARLEGVDFDTVVGTGISGILGAHILARGMGKHLAIVRKEGEVSNHGGYLIEGQIGKRWLFVDDLIASGDTRRHVIRSVKKVAPGAIFAGSYLYIGWGMYNEP